VGRLLTIGVAGALAAVCLASVRPSAAGGAAVMNCPVSHVHYRPSENRGYTGAPGVPWLATAPAGTFAAYLFFDGATPWSRHHLLGARIFTTVKQRPIHPKVLWIPRRRGAGTTLLIAGRRLDEPARFTARYPRASGSEAQFPSYVEIPQAGCWRVTARSGRLVGSVVFAAVDSF
jgi:hypothetical protein